MTFLVLLWLLERELGGLHRALGGRRGRAQRWSRAACRCCWPGAPGRCSTTALGRRHGRPDRQRGRGDRGRRRRLPGGRAGLRDARAGGAVAPQAAATMTRVDQGSHPQLLHHRPHRPRQVDAGRPHPPGDRRGQRARHAQPGARLDGPRARARHHHQGPGGARPLHRRRRRDLPAQPDRHPRATSTSATRSRAAWPPARARCWWWTPARASRPRRSPTPTWPSRATSS